LFKKSVEGVPKQFRTMAQYLHNNPFYRSVCDAIENRSSNYRPPDKKTVKKLIKTDMVRHGIDECKLPEIFNELESKDLLHVEQENNPKTYHPTSLSWQVLDFMKLFEEKTIGTLAKELKIGDPEYDPIITKALMNSMYSLLA